MMSETDVRTAQKNADLAKRHPLADEVDVDLDLLGLAMLYRVGGHICCTDVVAVNKSGQT